MPRHARFEGNIAVPHKLDRSMNDPRHADVRLEIQDLLDDIVDPGFETTR